MSEINEVERSMKANSRKIKYLSVRAKHSNLYSQKETDRDKERDTQRDRERQGERDTHRHRHTERQR